MTTHKRAMLALLILGGLGAAPARAQDADADGVVDDIDLCAETPWSEISYSAIKPNKWAVAWGEFVFISRKDVAPEDAYTLAKTRGCSCTQIVDELQAAGGKGTRKLSSRGGCDDSVLDLWIAGLPAGKVGELPDAPLAPPTPVAELPLGVTLDNYPNPFNPTTTIRFEVQESSVVRVAVYNLLGTPVDILVDETVSAGVHEVRFSASGLPSGIYLVRLDLPGHVVTRPIQLMK